MSLACIIFVSVIPNPLSYFIEVEEGVIQTDIQVFPSNNENFVGYFSFDYEKVHCSFNIKMDSVDINRVGDKAKEKGFTCEFHLDNSVGTAFPNTINLIEKVSANLRISVGKWACFCSNGTHTLVYWHSLIDRMWLNQTLRAVLDASDQELETLFASTWWFLFDREANWTVLKQYLGSFQEEHAITAGMMAEDWSNGHFMYAVNYITIRTKVQVRSGLTIEVISFTSNINVMGWTDLHVNTTCKMDQNAIRNVFKTIFKELNLPTNWLNNVSFAENWRIHLL